MKIRLVVSLCFFTLSSTAFGGGGGSSSGGAGADVDNTPTTLNLAGTWQGKSVVQCSSTACNWNIECSINQNGNSTNGACTSVLTNDTRAGCHIPDVTDPFTSTISGNKTTLDFYNQPESQNLQVTINSDSMISVPSVNFSNCVQSPFTINKI